MVAHRGRIFIYMFTSLTKNDIIGLYPNIKVLMIDYTTLTVERLTIDVPTDYPEHIVYDERSSKPKILILGHARHGKDTVSEILRDKHDFAFNPSSILIAEWIWKNYLPNEGYKSAMDCFEDRGRHRPTWFEAIATFNKDDPCAHAKNVLRGGDIYCGMRRLAELQECIKQGLFDYIVWVDASDRHELEPKSSFDIPKTYAGYFIDNNGSLEDLYVEVAKFVEFTNV